MIVADAVSDDKSGVGHDTEVPVFARSRSSQATEAIDVVGQESLDVVEKFSEMLGNVARELSNPVPVEATRNAVRSRASLVPSAGVEDADHVALRTQIQELQVNNENLSARRAWN